MDKFRIRHETLGILSRKAYEVMYDTEENKGLSEFKMQQLEILTIDIIDELGITEYEFRSANTIVSYSKEFTYSLGQYGKEVLHLHTEGIIAYENRKYLKEKKDIRNEKVYSLTKWLLPFLSLLIALAALWFTLTKKSTTTVNIYTKGYGNIDSAKMVQ